MPRTLTPRDAHVIMSELVRQGTAQKNISIVDTSDFVSAGETLLATGMENVFNTIHLFMGRIMFASRPYDALLKLIDAINTGVYTHRMAKVSYYSLDPVATGHSNTDLFLNLADGFTAGENKKDDKAQSTKSQWEQNQRPSAVFNFGGTDEWQFPITMYEDQVQQAFRSEAEFNSFIEGYMTEHRNDYESQREAFNRMTILSKVGQVYDMASVMPGSRKNLTTEFNKKFGTNYTSAQLRSTHLKEFLEFFVAEFKADSGYMRERSANYHWSVPKEFRGKTHHILRHTPYADQRVYLYSRLFKDAESLVMPEIFNDDYLDLDTQYQDMTYWQSNADNDSRSKVYIKPAIIDTDTKSATYGTQVPGADVQLDYVVGMICDVDSLMTDFQLKVARTTPVEARKGYRNSWLTVQRNSIVDPTENTILYYMDDTDVTTEGDTKSTKKS